MSDIAPLVMGCFAFVILCIGLMYVFRPEQTGRSLVASKSEIRKTGYVTCLLACALLYASYIWWKP